MTILLLVPVVILGLTGGMYFWTNYFGKAWFTRTLRSDDALAEFYDLFYAPRGGLAYALQQERSEWALVPTSIYAAVIRHQLHRLILQTRISGGILLIFGVIFYIASGYTSFVVFIAFLCSCITPALPCKYNYSAQAFAIIRAKRRIFETPSIGKNNYAVQALVNLFRPVRLWMEADRASLEQCAGKMKIDAIIRVIDSKDVALQRVLISRPLVSVDQQDAAHVLVMAGYNLQTSTNMEIGMAASCLEHQLCRERRHNLLKNTKAA